MKINKTKFRFEPTEITRNPKTSGHNTAVPKTLDNDIIKFDSKNVTLSEVRGDGSVTLEAEVEIDVLSAVKQGITTLDINLSKFSDSDSLEASQLSPERIVNNVLTGFGNMKVTQLEKDEKLIKKIKLDITKSIDNSIASSMHTISQSEFKKKQSSRRNIFKTVPIFKNKQTSLETPVFQTPIVNPKTQLSDRTTRQILHDSLFKDSKPIGSHSHKNIPYISSEEAMGGVKGKNKNDDQRRRLTTSKTRTSRELRNNDLIDKILDGNVNDVASVNDIYKRQTDNGNTTTAVVLESETSTIKTTTAKFNLTRKEILSLGNNFNIEIEAEDKDGKVIQRSGCCIDLVEKIVEGLIAGSSSETINDGTTKDLLDNSTRYTPTSLDGKDEEGTIIEVPGYAPEPTGPGTVDLSIHVFDPYKPLDFAERENTGPFGESPNSQSRGAAITVIRDSAPTFSPPAAKFNERIIPSLTRHLASAHSSLGRAVAEVDNRFVSISAFTRSTGILLYLTGFQSKYSIAVIRRDLTLKEKNFKFLNVDNPVQIVDENLSNLTFVDKDVKYEHTYEYKTKIFTREGREILGTQTAIITYKQLADNKVSMKVSKPDIRINSQGVIDARFNITTEIDDTNISALLTALKQQGVSDVFLSDITNNRERLKQLIAYKIERVDLTLGITEHIGIISSGKFSDVDTRSTSNALPLEGNKDYRYVIELLVRDIDSLVPEAEREKTDAGTNKSYTVKPSKYLHPTTLRTGTFRSDKKIKDAIYSEEMTAGYIGVQMEVSISTKTSRPKILGGSCTVDVQGRSVITWKISGRSKEFDHFIITSERLGMKAIVGRAQVPSYNSTYTFIDSDITNTTGDVNYFIQPVYSDLTYGNVLKLGKVEVNKTKRKKL